MLYGIAEELVTDSKIINLRLQGMNESEIIKQLQNEIVGRDIYKICAICRDIVIQSEVETTIKNVRQLDKRIFELREQRSTYEEIAQQLKKEGIEISLSIIQQRCQNKCAEKKMEEPNIRGRKK